MVHATNALDATEHKTSHRRVALTSWSLHRSLEAGDLQLIDLPARARAAGIGTLEICYFHLPSTEAAYLDSLRAALAEADVELFSILIDTGDISSADPQRRADDMALIKHWMDIAQHLGARVARVVAGESPVDDEAALARSIDGLSELAEYGRERGLRVLTENFRSLASTAANCNHILDGLGDKVGLCADIGNFAPSERVAEFTDVVARAESVHVKASYDETGELLGDDVAQCLDASLATSFSGPYTLVYDRPGDSWAGIAKLKSVVEPYTR